MSDYIKNVQMNSNLNKPQENSNVNFGIIKTKNSKFDSFEIDRDKAIKIGAGTAATGLIIWKRKEIGNIFEKVISKVKNFLGFETETTIKTTENIKPETPKPGQKPEPKPVIKLTPTEQLTKELAEIQKQIDPNVDTSKMKFGDIMYSLDRDIRTQNDSTPLEIRRQIVSIRKKAIEQNISFIPTVKITPNMSEKEIVDSVCHVQWYMNRNEASCLEGLEWMKQNGKYANHIDFGKHIPMADTFVDQVTVALRLEDKDKPQYVTDKVLNKYIDVYNLYHKSWDSYGFMKSDAGNLDVLFKDYTERMSKETAFRYLDAMERTSRTNDTACTFKLWGDFLKIDEESKKEFIKRSTIMFEKLPRFENQNSERVKKRLAKEQEKIK